jgi:hypothetical protein
MALEQRVLNDHFTSKAAPSRKLARKFRLAAENHFDIVTEEERERQYLAKLEEAVLAMGLLQRLMTCGKKRRRKGLNQLLLALLNDKELSPRFRTEIEEVISDRRDCGGGGPKPEDEAHSRTEEMHEMRSIDDEPKREEWKSVLKPQLPVREIGMFV